MDVGHYSLLKEAAELEHRLNIEAIERVRRMEQTLAGSSDSLPASRNGAPNNRVTKHRSKKTLRAGPRKGKLLDAVRNVIAIQKGTFTRYMIESHLQAAVPGMVIKKGSLKSVLKRLADDGELDVIVAPQGRRPAEYRVGKVKTGS